MATASPQRQTRYLSLDDYLNLAAVASGSTPAAIAAKARLDLADAALNLPAGFQRGFELYPDLLEKASVLCVRLVRSRALLPVRANLVVGFTCMRAFLAMNKVKLRFPTAESVLAGDEDLLLGLWLLEQIQEGRAGEAEMLEWLLDRTGEKGG